VAYVLTVGLLVGGGYLLASRFLGPWFNYESWDVPLTSLQPGWSAPVALVGSRLLGSLGLWTLAAVLSCAPPSQPLSGKSGAWLCMAAAAALAGLFSTQRAGFGPASVLPALVVLSVLGPSSMQRVARHLAAWPGSSRHEGEAVLLAGVALQFLALLPALPLESWLR
jgi:hypothetical protein